MWVKLWIQMKIFPRNCYPWSYVLSYFRNKLTVKVYVFSILGGLLRENMQIVKSFEICKRFESHIFECDFKRNGLLYVCVFSLFFHRLFLATDLGSNALVFRQRL